jgi:hypothetical protein
MPMSKPKRFFIISIAIILIAGYAAWRIREAFTTEETRVRRVIEAIETAFNRERAGAIADYLADDFHEEESGVDRDEARLFLFQFFLAERDREGGPRFSVQVDEGDVEVVFPDGDGKANSAEARVNARFFDRSSGGPSPFGTFLFTAQLSKIEGEWLIRRARHKKIEGRWPF